MSIPFSVRTPTVFPFPPHRRTEEATQLVSRMDSDLQDMHKSLSRSHTIIETCRTEFETLPGVVKAVEAARQKVEEIGKLLRQVEEDMLENSRTSAQLETERSHHSLKIQSEKHREQQGLELKRLEGILSEEKRLTTERQLELKSQKIQERQKTFQDMFDRQMADYRESGEVERPIGSSGGERERAGSHLEEVEIEDEGATASLNEFLSDVVLESPEQREGSCESEERAGESEERAGESEERAGESEERAGEQKGEAPEQREESGDQPAAEEEEEEEFHDVPES